MSIKEVSLNQEIPQFSSECRNETNQLIEKEGKETDVASSSSSYQTRIKRMAALTGSNPPNIEDIQLMDQCYNNADQWPALHWAIARLQRPDIALKILHLNPEQAKLLSPQVKDDQEFTIWGRKNAQQRGIRFTEKVRFTTSPASALLLAVQSNNAVLVRALLERGADPSLSQSVGTLNIDNKPNQVLTPIGVAIQNGNIEIAKLLLEAGASLEHVYISEPLVPNLPIRCSPRHGFIVHREEREDFNALFFAFKHSASLDLLRMILAKHTNRSLDAISDPNLKLIFQCFHNNAKWPALHWAIARLHRPDIALEILRLDPKQAKLLSSETVEYDEREFWTADTYNGEYSFKDSLIFTSSPASALLLAVQENNPDLVRKLLELGADPSFSQSIKKLNKDNKPNQILTPIGVAIQKGNAEILNLLLTAGASLEHVYISEFLLSVDYGRRTKFTTKREARKDFSALFLALEPSTSPQLLKMIVAKHANLSVDAIGDADLALIYKYTKDGWPPLHRACMEGNISAITRLIELGINANESYGKPNLFDLLPQSDLLHPVLVAMKKKGYPVPPVVLEKAVAKDDAKLLRFLFDVWKQIPPSLFTEQNIANKPNVLECLIQQGIQFDGAKLITHACEKGSLPVMKIAVRKYGFPKERVKELIQIAVKTNRNDLLDYFLNPSLFLQ